jgi:hypothetical protein
VGGTYSAHCNKLKGVAFEFQGPPWLGSLDLEAVLLFDANGQRLGPPTELVARRWNENLLPQDPGLHADLELVSGPTFVQREGRFYPVRVRAEIEVEKEMYFGKLPLTKIQGFQDVQTGGVLTRGYTTAWFSYDLIQTEWQRLEAAEMLAVTPGLEIEMVVQCSVPESR